MLVYRAVRTLCSTHSPHRSAITTTTFKTTVTGSMRVYIPMKPRQAPRIQDQVFRIWLRTAVTVKSIWWLQNPSPALHETQSLCYRQFVSSKHWGWIFILRNRIFTLWAVTENWWWRFLRLMRRKKAVRQAKIRNGVSEKPLKTEKSSISAFCSAMTSRRTA